MNIAIVTNIYGFPSEAFYGLTSISLYLIGVIIFMVPVSLVSAELGSMFPTEGGIFTWVNNAFNFRPGIVATWLQWVQSIFFYPLSLTFAAVTFAYVLPDHIVAELANSKVYIILFILIIFWFCTFSDTLGMRHIGRLSTWGVWVGIFIPVALLIGFGVYYICAGGHIEMSTDPAKLIPRFTSTDDVVMAASILLFFSGLEVNGAHVYMMKNPAKGYPKALLWTAVIIGGIYILGTLAVAVIIPEDQLNSTQSVIVSFKRYSDFIGVRFIMPIVAVALTFGVLANTITWISGPATVLKYIANRGYLPQAVNKTNKNGAPLFILVTQGAIVTVIAFVYVLLPQIQQGFQMLMQMTNAIYLTMYVIFYISFLRLRYKMKNTPRPFMAGGRTLFGAWCVALVGLIGAVGTFFICFFPPQQMDISKSTSYVWTVIAIYVCLILPPILYLIFRNKKIKATQAAMAAQAAAPEAPQELGNAESQTAGATTDNPTQS